MSNGNDEVMTFYIQKGQLYCDMIMFYTNTFLAIIKQCPKFSILLHMATF